MSSASCAQPAYQVSSMPFVLPLQLFPEHIPLRPREAISCRTTDQTTKALFPCMAGKSLWYFGALKWLIPEPWALGSQRCFPKLYISLLTQPLPPGLAHAVAFPPPHHVSKFNSAGLPHPEPESTYYQQESAQSNGNSDFETQFVQLWMRRRLIVLHGLIHQANNWTGPFSCGLIHCRVKGNQSQTEVVEALTL